MAYGIHLISPGKLLLFQTYRTVIAGVSKFTLSGLHIEDSHLPDEYWFKSYDTPVTATANTPYFTLVNGAGTNFYYSWGFGGTKVAVI